MLLPASRWASKAARLPLRPRPSSYLLRWLPFSVRSSVPVPVPVPVRYESHIARNPTHATLTSEHVQGLAQQLSTPSRSLLTSLSTSSSQAQQVQQDELDAHNNDWMGKYHGQSQVVVKPRSTAEVSHILRYCNQHNIAVVPQGGNTGLVGVGVPV